MSQEDYDAAIRDLAGNTSADGGGGGGGGGGGHHVEQRSHREGKRAGAVRPPPEPAALDAAAATWATHAAATAGSRAVLDAPDPKTALQADLRALRTAWARKAAALAADADAALVGGKDAAQTLLGAASASGDVAGMERAVAAGADVHSAMYDAQGRTPAVKLAKRQAALDQATAALQAVQEEGERNKAKKLTLSARHAHNDALKEAQNKLKKCRDDFEHKKLYTKSQVTLMAVDVCARHTNYAGVRFLVGACGVDPNGNTHMGGPQHGGAARGCALRPRATPIHYACKKTDVGMLYVLLGLGADPTRADENGGTPCMYTAARGGRASILCLRALAAGGPGGKLDAAAANVVQTQKPVGTWMQQFRTHTKMTALDVALEQNHKGSHSEYIAVLRKELHGKSGRTCLIS